MPVQHDPKKTVDGDVLTAAIYHNNLDLALSMAARNRLTIEKITEINSFDMPGIAFATTSINFTTGAREEGNTDAGTNPLSNILKRQIVPGPSDNWTFDLLELLNDSSKFDSGLSDAERYTGFGWVGGPFYDDFDDASFDATKWATGGSSPIVGESGGKVTLRTQDDGTFHSTAISTDGSTPKNFKTGGSTTNDSALFFARIVVKDRQTLKVQIFDGVSTTVDLLTLGGNKNVLQSTIDFGVRVFIDATTGKARASLSIHQDAPTVDISALSSWFIRFFAEPLAGEGPKDAEILYTNFIDSSFSTTEQMFTAALTVPADPDAAFLYIEGVEGTDTLLSEITLNGSTYVTLIREHLTRISTLTGTALNIRLTLGPWNTSEPILQESGQVRAYGLFYG